MRSRIFFLLVLFFSINFIPVRANDGPDLDKSHIMKNATAEVILSVCADNPEISKLITILELSKLEAAAVDGEAIKKVKLYKKLSLDKKVERIINGDYESMSEPEKDVFYEWHKWRVLEIEGVKKVLPKNTETHTIVTGLGNVCIIRKPIGRVLGQVMSKIGGLNKDPDFYEAGSIILRECKIWMEPGIETDPDQLFSVKMACLGSTNIIESQIKKN